MNSFKIVISGSGITAFRMLIGAINAHYYLVSGVSLKELALLKMIYSTTVLLAEVPTGYLADKYSRKGSVIAACLLFTSFYVLCLFSPKMLFLYTAEICYGLAMCCVSGSLAAWLTTTIKHEFPAQPKKINEYFHWKGEISAVGSAFCGLFGTIVLVFFPKQFSVVYVLAAICFILLSLFIISIPDVHSQDTDDKQDLRALYALWKSEFNHKPFLLFLIAVIALAAAFQPMAHYWQPLFNNLHADDLMAKQWFKESTTMLGVVFFIYCLVIYLANKIVRNLLHRYSHGWMSEPLVIGAVVSLVAGGLSLLFLLVPNHSILFATILFALLYGTHSVIGVIAQAEYAKSAPASRLSMLLSITSLMGRVSSIIVLICITQVIDRFPIIYFFAWNLIWFSIITIVMWYGYVTKAKTPSRLNS